MIADHIHHALAQVQELQQKILEKQRFKGYSGRARAISGTAALAASIVMSSRSFPKTAAAHLAGWDAVLLFAMVLNFGAILYWFLFDPAAKRDLRRLKPILDVVPALIVAAVFSFATIAQGYYSMLFGIWMSLFGVANLATRHVLPRKIWLLGVYYIACGAGCLLMPFSFLNPWPMGIVFFIGEWAGGFILHFDEGVPFSFRNFWKFQEDYHAESGSSVRGVEADLS